MMKHSILAIALLGSLCGPARAQFPASVALPGDLNFGSSAGSQEKPSIAFGGNHYLAVWEDGRSALAGVVDQPDGFHPNRDVYATLLDASGALTQSVPLVIDQSCAGTLTSGSAGPRKYAAAAGLFPLSLLALLLLAVAL